MEVNSKKAEKESLLEQISILAPWVFIFVVLIVTVWLAWCFFMQMIWPAGPETIVNPGFWMFYFEVFCINLFKSLLFRS